ncbi:SDR family oxidoreductase [Ohtaekwangia sp.]|uniref:SDR family oxidoreductase n=1 Tax=Ohtaekwangia sp. TaxID=2066019 RepID=UPI002F958085
METTMIKNPPPVKPQHQERQPGIEQEMTPRPIYDSDDEGYGRLKGKVAIITGGDSGIGRAVAIQFAKEGADVAIAYLDEHEDAEETAAAIRKYGKEALLIPTDVSQEVNCKNIVDLTLERFKRIDILVNNAAVQYEQQNVESISAEQWEYTFRVNIFAYFYMVKYTVPHLQEGSSIINTASVTAYKGNQTLMDYSSTKGAIVAFTRSLSQSLVEKGIRVNAVAPGPVWTPLIPASFNDEKVEKFGKDTPLGRPAQPVEIAPSYVFLASKEGSFFSGQVLHPNGGSVINT